MRLPWRTYAVGIAAVSVLAVAAVAAPNAVLSGEEEYSELDELPRFAEDAEDVPATAIALADELGEPPVSAASDRACPADQLEVSWDAPEGYEYGTYIEPVGPAPTDDGYGAVNGVVLCETSDYGFMGFEALRLDDGRWQLWAVPTHEERDDTTQPDLGPDFEWDGEFDWLEPWSFDLEPDDVADGLDLRDLGPIDPYAAFEPQRICHPAAKPGAVALSDLILHAFPETQSYGISRDCDIGGRSEHKEGRAFDWGVDANDPEERAIADALVDLLLAPDAEGNEHALARRMGIMYIIWDGQVWSSHRPDEGWRPYRHPSGAADPTLDHEDHVHISLSWEGAMGRTSLWRALLGEGRLAALPPLDLAAAPPRLDTEPVTSAVMRWDESSVTEQRRARTAEPDDEPEQDDGSSEQTADEQDDDGSESDDTLTSTVEDSADDVEETVDDTVDEVDDTVDDTEDTVDDTVDETVDETSQTIEDLN